MISFPELSKPVAVYLTTSPVLATSWFEVISILDNGFSETLISTVADTPSNSAVNLALPEAIAFTLFVLSIERISELLVRLSF